MANPSHGQGDPTGNRPWPREFGWDRHELRLLHQLQWDSSWRTRRVEAFTPEDERHYTHSTGLQFRLTGQQLSPARFHVSRQPFSQIVPFLRLRKELILKQDVFDERNQRQTVLSRDADSDLSFRFVKRLLGHLLLDVDESTERLIRAWIWHLPEDQAEVNEVGRALDLSFEDTVGDISARIKRVHALAVKHGIHDVQPGDDDSFRVLLGAILLKHAGAGDDVRTGLQEAVREIRSLYYEWWMYVRVADLTIGEDRVLRLKRLEEIATDKARPKRLWLPAMGWWQRYPVTLGDSDSTHVYVSSLDSTSIEIAPAMSLIRRPGDGARNFRTIDSSWKGTDRVELIANWMRCRACRIPTSGDSQVPHKRTSKKHLALYWDRASSGGAKESPVLWIAYRPLRRFRMAYLISLAVALGVAVRVWDPCIASLRCETGGQTATVVAVIGLLVGVVLLRDNEPLSAHTLRWPRRGLTASMLYFGLVLVASLGHPQVPAAEVASGVTSEAFTAFDGVRLLGRLIFLLLRLLGLLAR